MIAISDLKYAVRLLSKKPGFTVLTTLVMATGIGLSLFLLSFLNSMVFKALPFEDGESLIQIGGSQNGVRGEGDPISLHDYYEIRTNLKGVSEFSAYNNMSVNASGRDGARRYNAISSEPNIFQLTRTKPLLGREFTSADNRQGAEPVVVIGYDMWQNQFGGNSEVLDQTVRINNLSHRVIGVMPEGYYFPNTADLWIPMQEDAVQLARGDAGKFYGLAHLDKGVSMDDINNDLMLIMRRIEEKYPNTNNGISAFATTIPGTAVQNGISVIYSMQVVAILILLLASINVGNLLLSRAVERQKETAIRVALGAPRSRLISQMLWESIIICSIGGIIGLLMVTWGLSVTEKVTATFFYGKPVFWFKFGLDAFTIKLFIFFVLSTILITGLLPAWKNSGADFNTVLRDGTRGALGKNAGRLNRLIINSEIFVSMMVLIASSVMIVAAYMRTHTDYGANTENILTARVLLTESSYNSPDKKVQFVKTLQANLENSASIADVMITTALPGLNTSSPAVAIEGSEYTKDKGYPRANYIQATAGSLEKLGVELKQGRYFNSSDDTQGQRSVIVTESFSSRHFPNKSPIGQRLRMVELDGDEPQWLTVVGVVEHTYQGAPNESSGKTPSIFRPYSQAPDSSITIALKMKSDKAEVIRSLRKTLAAIDSDLPAYGIEMYADKLTRLSAPLRFISKIFLLFGLAAVVLAGSGIYGVMSNTITQRTQEIGVKRALGSWEQRITKEFLMKTGVKQLLWGGIPGLLAGCAIGFAMSQIFATGNATLLIIASIMITVIGSVVMLSTYFPIRRTLRLEPSEALRYE